MTTIDQAYKVLSLLREISADCSEGPHPLDDPEDRAVRLRTIRELVGQAAADAATLFEDLQETEND